MSVFDHTEKEAANILGVSLRTLRGYRKQEVIGYYRLPGGRVRYGTDQLTEFVRVARVRATKGD